MPNRVLRAGVWASDRFLDLPDNTHRICYLRCISEADDMANMEATDGSLIRLWRDLGIDSRSKALSILEHLVEAGLLATYDAQGRRHVHIPRFQQRVRHVVKRCAPSPWDNEIIQLVPETPDARQAVDGRATDARRLEAEVETESKSEERRGTRLRADSPFPGAWQQFCLDRRPDLDPVETYRRFRDYWIAQPGARGVKLDWGATWRNWVRRERVIVAANGLS